MTDIHQHQLWATPVWEINLGVAETFNQELLNAINSIRPASAGVSFNLFDYADRPIIAQFEQRVLEATREAFRRAGIKRTIKGMRSASVNTMGYLEWDTPHSHAYVMLAGVYYAKVPEGSGELWLLDPRGGGLFWGEEEGFKHGRVGKAIKPAEGKLVVFPGDLQHFVTPNQSRDSRVSIALNFMAGI
jgi:hypothetical protein